MSMFLLFPDGGGIATEVITVSPSIIILTSGKMAMKLSNNLYQEI
jgi:hypothetical protein